GPAAPARPKHPKIHLQSPRQSTAASTANVTANLTKPTTARATNGVVKKASGSLAVSANIIAPERISKDVTRATEEVAKSATAPKSPPADSPAAWVALAATRREVGSDRITYTPIVDVRKGVVTGTNHAPNRPATCHSPTTSSTPRTAAARSTSARRQGVSRTCP